MPTPLETSAHDACLNSVLSRIQGLSIPLFDADTAFPTDHMILAKMPWVTRFFGPTAEGKLTPPGIIVSPLGFESFLGGTNRRDDIGYPAFVTIVVADNEDVTDENLNAYTLWRQMISDGLRNQRLSVSLATGDSVMTVSQSDTEVAMPEIFTLGYWVSSLSFSCQVRKSRANT